MQVGVAHAGRGDPDPHLAGARRREFDVRHLDRVARADEDYSAHCLPFAAMMVVSIPSSETVAELAERA
jgi:hypothetical protein